MKVVLFCGGRGFLTPGQTDICPKPMTTIGYRPVLWHVMRYYAHYGLREFILCLGFKGELIKEYFLKYNEATSNDFVMSQGGRIIELMNSDISEWDITFADTMCWTGIGDRLAMVRPHLQDDDIFCANYGDTLTDAPLDVLIEDFRSRGRIAAFLTVRPRYSFHAVSHGDDGLVTGIADVERANLWVNGGYFIFRKEIFDYLRPGEDLLEDTFQELICRDQVLSYRHEGFWSGLDTLRDLHELRSLQDSGLPPWVPSDRHAVTRLSPSSATAEEAT